MAGISAGTTPGRYCSSRSSLTTVTVGAMDEVHDPQDAAVLVVGPGLRVDLEAAGAGRAADDEASRASGPSCRIVPAGLLTRIRHVVRVPLEVVVVDGVTRSIESIGNVFAIPSIDQAVIRP